MHRTISQARFEEQRDAFRDAFLVSLDRAARDLGHALRVPVHPHAPGATDADLPELFKAVDAQLLRLLARAGVTVEED